MRAQSTLHNLINNTQSLVQGEANWIRQGPDLAAVGCGTEHGWLNSFLEDTLNWLSRRATLVSLIPNCLAKQVDILHLSFLTYKAYDGPFQW